MSKEKMSSQPTNVLLVSDCPLPRERRRRYENEFNTKIISYKRVYSKNRTAWSLRASYEATDIVRRVLADERITAIHYFLGGVHSFEGLKEMFSVVNEHVLKDW